MVTVPRFENVASRVVPRPYHDRVGPALVVAIGVSAFLFHLQRLPGGQNRPVVFLAGSLSPLVLSILLIGGGGWLQVSGYERLGLRVGGWCLVGVGILTGISLLTVQYQTAHGVDLRGVGVVVSATATGGGVVGFLIGVYDPNASETSAGWRRNARKRSVWASDSPFSTVFSDTISETT